MSLSAPSVPPPPSNQSLPLSPESQTLHTRSDVQLHDPPAQQLEPAARLVAIKGARMLSNLSSFRTE